MPNINMIQKSYTQTISISEPLAARISELISHYPAGKKQAALLPVLHAVQDAHDNWLSVALMDKVAELLDLQPIQVYEVVTFYTMFNQRPMGKYMLEFCRTSCCALRGAEELIEYTCEKLGVKQGETTADGMFSVVSTECLGACGYAPMLQLGDHYYENLTKEKIDALIEDCRQGNINLY